MACHCSRAGRSRSMQTSAMSILRLGLVCWLAAAAAGADAGQRRRHRAGRAARPLTVAEPQAAASILYDVDTEHFLRYPPKPLPAKACACRMDINRQLARTTCPSPFDTPAGTRMVPPPLKLTAEGDILDESSGERAVLHGINWFGWETATPNVDGLWAYDDDDVPPAEAVSNASRATLQLDYWGKRTMTNDFAHVVHRTKALGFNAIRIPFNFSNLARDLPVSENNPSEFFACVRDPINYINMEQTLDPALRATAPASDFAAVAPAYTGMRHPPPSKPEDGPVCSRPWSAPFASDYQAQQQYGDTLQLTLCNWYLPQGPGVQAVHRFLWEVQYLVAQGFYVMVDHSSYLERDPNMLSPALFAANWGNLWRMMTELPSYNRLLRGRVFPDLVNEPSRWGCQWERECLDSTGQKACAPGAQLYHAAMKSIHVYDPTVPVFANALGQAGVDANKFPTCANAYRGMNYGDGTITNPEVIASTGISDASVLFEVPAISMGKLALSPHVYPATVTGWGEDTQRREELFQRLDLSFGLKALGLDMTSDMKPLRRIAVVLAEFGVFGFAAAPNGRGSGTSDISSGDLLFLRNLSDYLKRIRDKGATISWFWWALNANAQDTKGLLGPDTTWKQVDFVKVQLLTELFGLRPWYCKAAPQACGVASDDSSGFTTGRRLMKVSA